MCTTATTTLFLAREKPLATLSSAGQFQLQMLCFDPLEHNIREPWRLGWTGPQAQAWWAQHGATLQAGDAITAEVTRLRAHSTPRGAEIHARVLRLHPPRRQGTPQPARAPVFPPLGHAAT